MQQLHKAHICPDLVLAELSALSSTERRIEILRCR